MITHGPLADADGAEANVFRLAGSALRSRLPAEASRLKAASAAYFEQHPDEQLPAAEVVRSGLVVSMPRLRDMLSHKLRWNARDALEIARNAERDRAAGPEIR